MKNEDKKFADIRRMEDEAKSDKLGRRRKRKDNETKIRLRKRWKKKKIYKIKAERETKLYMDMK